MNPMKRKRDKRGTIKEFEPIERRLRKHMLVHVEGWKRGCVFEILGWDELEEMVQIMTPASGRKYTVDRSKLRHTLKDSEEIREREVHHELGM